jgi:hypothetical protein
MSRHQIACRQNFTIHVLSRMDTTDQHITTPQTAQPHIRSAEVQYGMLAADPLSIDRLADAWACS